MMGHGTLAAVSAVAALSDGYASPCNRVLSAVKRPYFARAAVVMLLQHGAAYLQLCNAQRTHSTR